MNTTYSLEILKKAMLAAMLALPFSTQADAGTADPIKAAFERELNRTPTPTAPLIGASEADVLQTRVNAILRPEPDLIHMAFAHDLNRAPTPTGRFVSTVSNDPLYVWFVPGAHRSPSVVTALRIQNTRPLIP